VLGQPDDLETTAPVGRQPTVGSPSHQVADRLVEREVVSRCLGLRDRHRIILAPLRSIVWTTLTDNRNGAQHRHLRGRARFRR